MGKNGITPFTETNLVHLPPAQRIILRLKPLSCVTKELAIPTKEIINKGKRCQISVVLHYNTYASIFKRLMDDNVIAELKKTCPPPGDFLCEDFPDCVKRLSTSERDCLYVTKCHFLFCIKNRKNGNEGCFAKKPTLYLNSQTEKILKKSCRKIDKNP